MELIPNGGEATFPALAAQMQHPNRILRVVRVGAHIFGINQWCRRLEHRDDPVEVGNDSGNLMSLSVVEDGLPSDR